MAAAEVAYHGEAGYEEVALFEQQAVEYSVAHARRVGQPEPAGRFAVEDECHECVEIELPVLGAHMQRNGVHMAQLLDALHDIGQLAQTVLAFVGRALRSGGEDAEREDVDEMQSVDHAAIERLHLARDDLSGRFERVLGHADDAGEIVGRACGDDAQFERQPPFAHPVDDVIDRAVAAATTIRMSGCASNGLRPKSIFSGVSSHPFSEKMSTMPPTLRAMRPRPAAGL